MYATLEDYKKIFLMGREQLIPDASFPFYSSRASETIGLIELDTIPNYLVKCTCEVAEILFNQNSSISQSIKGVQSEKIGSYSVTFADLKTLDITTRNLIRSTIIKYLANTNLHNDLVYLGVCK